MAVELKKARNAGGLRMMAPGGSLET